MAEDSYRIKVEISAKRSKAAAYLSTAQEINAQYPEIYTYLDVELKHLLNAIDLNAGELSINAADLLVSEIFKRECFNSANPNYDNWLNLDNIIKKLETGNAASFYALARIYAGKKIGSTTGNFTIVPELISYDLTARSERAFHYASMAKKAGCKNIDLFYDVVYLGLNNCQWPETCISPNFNAWLAFQKAEAEKNNTFAMYVLAKAYFGTPIYGNISFEKNKALGLDYLQQVMRSENTSHAHKAITLLCDLKELDSSFMQIICNSDNDQNAFALYKAIAIIDRSKIAKNFSEKVVKKMNILMPPEKFISCVQEVYSNAWVPIFLKKAAESHNNFIKSAVKNSILLLKASRDYSPNPPSPLLKESRDSSPSPLR